MKRLFFILSIFSFLGFLSAVEIPEPKRPRPIDSEKALEASQKDETKDDEENFRNTIKFGIPSEINDLLDKLLSNNDPRFAEDIYDLFQVSLNTGIKQKILKYFTNLEDPCLEDYAVEVLIDPYDTKNEIVKAVFEYVAKVHTKEAVEPVVELIKSENEDYFNDAITTLGEIGSAEEAVFLAEFLERDDLTEAQRQSLMRTCGKMHAVETYDKILEILQNEDENSYVRSYAAEAIGLMQKEEAVPVLVTMFSSTDPNLRQYVIKGLKNFPEVVEAKAAVIQGVRDEHWKVRQESIRVCKELKITESVPYLIYRVKNDKEKVIKDECYSAIAAVNTQEGNDFLINQLKERKVGDGDKQKAVEVLLKEGNAGESDVLELAKSCVSDDKKKNLRYAIGKELAKNPKDSYEEICNMYLSSKDATTQGLGLDMYKNHKFASLETQLRAIYADKKANSQIKTRIKKMLDIPDEEEKDEKKEESVSSESKNTDSKTTESKSE